MNSVLSKAKKYITSNEGQKKIEQKIDDMVMRGGSGMASGGGQAITITGARDAAEKFIEVLQNEIKSLGVDGGYSSGKLGGSAISSLIQLKHGMPRKIGKREYQIEVWFTDDLHRDSLVPDRYNGVDNIAALLNKGYSAADTVYGTWHGNKIASLPKRDGAHFIENAIHNYMVSYANEYGVINIDVADIYK